MSNHTDLCRVPGALAVPRPPLRYLGSRSRFRETARASLSARADSKGVSRLWDSCRRLIDARRMELYCSICVLKRCNSDLPFQYEYLCIQITIIPILAVCQLVYQKYTLNQISNYQLGIHSWRKDKFIYLVTPPKKNKHQQYGRRNHSPHIMFYRVEVQKTG